MRHPVITAALCAVAAGCAARVPVSGAERLAPEEPPLQARLNPPLRGILSYWVNRPAYIAIFELIPDYGVSLLYPAYPWQESRVDEGSRWAALSSIPGRWFYLSGAGAQQVGFGFLKPRYLYLVASERPLRIGQLQRSPMLLRRTMSFTAYSVFNPRLTTDALDQLIVPNVEADNWVSDMYVLWPEIPLPRRPLAVLALAQSRPAMPVASTPDSGAKRDSTGAPGDSARSPRKTEEDPSGVRPPHGDWIRKTEGGGSAGGKSSARDEQRTIDDAEDIDVPWSPVRSTGRGDPREARYREALRDRGDAPRWSPNDDRRERSATEMDRAAMEAARREADRRESSREAAQGRSAERGAQPASSGSQPSRAEPSRQEPSRAEPSRAEPPRAEPPRAEPRSEPRSEPRGEQRSEPPRQPPQTPPGAER